MKQTVQTVQDLKTEIKVIKKTQTEGILHVKMNGRYRASIPNRIPEMEERSSGVEDTTEEIGSSVKENVKSKKFLTQNIQKIWDTMKRPSLRITGIEELQLKCREYVFNKIIEENFPNLKKHISMKVQEAYRTQNRLDQEKNSIAIY